MINSDLIYWIIEIQYKYKIYKFFFFIVLQKVEIYKTIGKRDSFRIFLRIRDGAIYEPLSPRAGEK